MTDWTKGEGPVFSLKNETPLQMNTQVKCEYPNLNDDRNAYFLNTYSTYSMTIAQVFIKKLQMLCAFEFLRMTKIKLFPKKAGQTSLNQLSMYQL